MRTPAPIIALSLMLAALPVAAQQAKQNLSRQDRSFAEHAMAGGSMEVQLGKMATERAQSQAVKDFGQRMATDHGKANQQLSQIASSAGVAPPKELPRDQRKTVDKLSKLKGAEFDRAYMSAMVDDHKKDINEFRKQADKGENAELKSFAQQTLPTLQEHLTLAQDTEAAIRSGQQAQTPR